MLDNLNSWRKLIFCLILVVTFFFGLNPKDFDGSHKPNIAQSGELLFKKYSIATIEENWLDSNGLGIKTGSQIFDVKLNITNIPTNQNRFSVIFSINKVNGDSLLLMGQWRDNFIVMSGDDFSNKYRKPRLSIPLSTHLNHTQNLLLEISATSDHTEVSINNQQVSSSQSYIVPTIQGKTRILLGNTLNRKHGWLGTLKAITFSNSFSSNSKPSKTQVKIISCCHQNYKENKSTIYVNSILTTNDSKKLKTEHESKELVLQSPYRILSASWFTTEHIHTHQSILFVKDILINFLGFTPISIAVLLLIEKRFNRLKTSLIAIFIVVSISFLIESIQAFIPSRTSSLIDLSVNSLSGFFTIFTVLAIKSKYSNTT